MRIDGFPVKRIYLKKYRVRISILRNQRSDRPLFFFFLRFPLFFVPNFFELLLSSLHTPIVDYAERALIVNYGVESVYVDAAGKPAGTDISNSKKR